MQGARQKDLGTKPPKTGVQRDEYRESAGADEQQQGQPVPAETILPTLGCAPHEPGRLPHDWGGPTQRPPHSLSRHRRQESRHRAPEQGTLVLLLFHEEMPGR